jgi:hypothetical protein
MRMRKPAKVLNAMMNGKRIQLDNYTPIWLNENNKICMKYADIEFECFPQHTLSEFINYCEKFTHAQIDEAINGT